jgi:hypothetical protein
MPYSFVGNSAREMDALFENIGNPRQRLWPKLVLE